MNDNIFGDDFAFKIVLLSGQNVSSDLVSVEILQLYTVVCANFNMLN